MKTFEGKLAVITGGGTGMGRELAVQLATEGCALALCDVSAANMAETQQRCETAAPTGTRITTFVCDVSEEAQVIAFRDAVLEEHQTDHINLLRAQMPDPKLVIRRRIVDRRQVQSKWFEP